jgi:hypothetical protein
MAAAVLAGLGLHSHGALMPLVESIVAQPTGNALHQLLHGSLLAGTRPYPAWHSSVKLGEGCSEPSETQYMRDSAWADAKTDDRMSVGTDRHHYNAPLVPLQSYNYSPQV